LTMLTIVIGRICLGLMTGDATGIRVPLWILEARSVVCPERLEV
jgi:hypothetical protein